MLTETTYDKGLVIHTQTKHSIVYNRCNLFNVVCANLAQKVLSSKYTTDISDEQRKKLESIINK